MKDTKLVKMEFDPKMALSDVSFKENGGKMFIKEKLFVLFVSFVVKKAGQNLWIAGNHHG